MKQITWKKAAVADRHNIYVHIGQDSLPAADEVDRAIREHVAMLAKFNEMGRPGRTQGTRELVVNGTPYVVAYKTSISEILILRILHGAQRWPKRF